jgi:hypothetical protein
LEKRLNRTGDKTGKRIGKGGWVVRIGGTRRHIRDERGLVAEEERIKG